MFNFRYNIIAFSQVFLNFINTLLLMKIFGVSSETDAYFMLLTIFSAIYLIQLMPIEQFIYFYNDARVKGRDNAEKFYNFALTLSFIIGLISLCFFLFADHYVLKVFVYKIDNERFFLLKTYSFWYKYVLLFMPFNYIFSSLMIAESKIGYSYISNILPNFFAFISLILSLFYNKKLSFVIGLTVLGFVLSFLVYTRIVKYFLGYRFKFNFYHEYASMYIKNSVLMRLGHNINNFGLPFFTNNFLSFFQQGYMSQFYYAQRISMSIQNIAVGPSSKVLQAKISRYISLEDFKNIRANIHKYIKTFLPVIFLSSILVYFLMPYILRVLSSGRLSVYDIANIQNMFVFFILWVLLLFLEGPFDMFLIANKDAKTFIRGNTIFVISYLLFFKLFFLVSKEYSIFCSLLISQLVSFVFYLYVFRRRIGILISNKNICHIT